MDLRFLIRALGGGVTSEQSIKYHRWQFAWLQQAVKSQGRWRCAEVRGLEGEAADHAMIGLAMMLVAMVIASFLEIARRIGWQTGP